jgi:hypothetical protein
VLQPSIDLCTNSVFPLKLFSLRAYDMSKVSNPPNFEADLRKVNKALAWKIDLQMFRIIRGCQTSDSEADLRSIKSTILVSI